MRKSLARGVAALALTGIAIVGYAGAATAAPPLTVVPAQGCIPAAAVAEVSHEITVTDAAAVTHVEYKYMPLFGKKAHWSTKGTKSFLIYDWTAYYKTRETRTVVDVPAVTHTETVIDTPAQEAIVCDAPIVPERTKDTLVCKAGVHVIDTYVTPLTWNDGLGAWSGTEVWSHKVSAPATAEECGYPNVALADKITLRCDKNFRVVDHYATVYSFDASKKAWVGTKTWMGKDTNADARGTGFCNVAYPGAPAVIGTGTGTTFDTSNLPTTHLAWSAVTNHIALNGKIGITVTTTGGYQFPDGKTSKVYAYVVPQAAV
jgi:hypothetical protein